MTSWTVDIHCNACRKYMFSFQPNNSKAFEKEYYCKAKACQMQATVDTLKKAPNVE